MTVYLLDKHDDAIPPKSDYLRVRVDIDPVDLNEDSVEWFSGGRGPGLAELCSRISSVPVPKQAPKEAPEAL